MKNKRIVLFLIVLFVACGLLLALCSCGEQESNCILQAEEISNLASIQESGSLYFEWLKEYNPEKPTVVIVHGERTGKGTEQFSLSLDPNEYTTSTTNPTDYVVANGIGHRALGLNLNLAEYWLNVGGYNVALFHWERFADEDSDSVLAKIFSLPKMKYILDDGTYETNAVPHNCLAEVFAALYVQECASYDLNEEVRWIGNGVGANLLVAAADYMLGYVKQGALDNKYLPDRLTLCDPYLHTNDLRLAGNKTTWGVSSVNGTYGMTEQFVKDLDSYVVMELVESKEVIIQGNDKQLNYAYDIPKSEKADKADQEIKKHVAYLEYTEKYSRLFSAEYKQQKRIAFDWYLYSIIGSDDSNNTGSNYSVGYPKELKDYDSYSDPDSTSYNTYFNWGPNYTRPMINNRALNNDGTSTVFRNRTKNFSLSAWTPTTYTAGFKGTAFYMREKIAQKGETDIHGNTTFTYKDYEAEFFRSENYQCSDADWTTVCGFVGLDKNKDGVINDGRSGLGNVRIHVTLMTVEEETVTAFDLTTEQNGFYRFSFPDGTKDSEGEIKDGYSFTNSYKVKITVEPNSNNYVQTPSEKTGNYYDTVRENNFTGYSCTVTLEKYRARGVIIKNCLVKPV